MSNLPKKQKDLLNRLFTLLAKVRKEFSSLSPELQSHDIAAVRELAANVQNKVLAEYLTQFADDLSDLQNGDN